MSGSGTARREPMSKVDTAWLRMEKPTSLMMITGVLMFEQHLDIAQLRELVAERFLAFERFRQKAVDLGGTCYWEHDPDFDLEWHVRLTALPGGAGTPSCNDWSASWHRPRWTIPSRCGSSIWWKTTTAAAP